MTGSNRFPSCAKAAAERSFSNRIDRSNRSGSRGQIGRIRHGAGKLRIQASALDYLGQPCNVSVSMERLNERGAAPYLKPVKGFGALAFELDWKDLQGYTLVLHYQAIDRYGIASDSIRKVNAIVYRPPGPSDAEAADFAPMRIGNQWLYAGKVVDDAIREKYQYRTRITVLDSFSREDTLFYKITCWDSVFGMESLSRPGLKEYTYTETTLAMERGGEVSYPKPADRPTTFSRTLFNHFHAFPKDRLVQQTIGSDPVLLYTDTFSSDPKYGSEVSTWTVMQNVGTLEFSKETKYPDFIFKAPSTVKVEGHLVSFAGGSQSYVGTLQPGAKSGLPAKMPSRILKGYEIRFLHTGKAYNGKGQEKR